MENILKKIAYIIIVILAVSFTIASLQSCRTSGYGCHGNQSWKQMVKRNGGGGW